MFSYNTTLHNSIKMSPHQAMFGYDARAPLWPDLQDLTREEVIIPGQDLYARQRQMQDLIRAQAHANNQHAREQYKQQHDSHKKTQWPNYLPGQQVFVRDHTPSKGNPKFEERWVEGEIIRQTGPSTFRVLLPHRKRKRTTVMNSKYIKPGEKENTQKPFAELLPEKTPEPDNSDTESACSDNDNQDNSDTESEDETFRGFTTQKSRDEQELYSESEDETQENTLAFTRKLLRISAAIQASYSSTHVKRPPLVSDLSESDYPFSWLQRVL